MFQVGRLGYHLIRQSLLAVCRGDTDQAHHRWQVTTEDHWRQHYSQWQSIEVITIFSGKHEQAQRRTLDTMATGKAQAAYGIGWLALPHAISH